MSSWRVCMATTIPLSPAYLCYLDSSFNLKYPCRILETRTWLWTPDTSFFTKIMKVFHKITKSDTWTRVTYPCLKWVLSPSSIAAYIPFTSLSLSDSHHQVKKVGKENP